MSCVLEKLTTGMDLKKCSESYFVCPNNFHTNVLSAAWLPDSWVTFLTLQIQVNMVYNWKFPYGKSSRGNSCSNVNVFSVPKSGGTWWALCKLPSVLYGPDEIPTNFSEAAGSTWIEAKSPSPSPLPQAERPCT